MFITFDGPNGVGKTTIISLVSEVLIGLGYSIFLTKEPTNSDFGHFFKKCEENYKGEPLASIAAADRYLHIENEIKPSLKRNELVISDRYIESSLVLQRLDGCSLEFIWRLNSKILIPDLSIIIVAKPSIINKRLLSRGIGLSRFEKNESRQKELKFYKEAVNFLRNKKFNVSVFDNNLISKEILVDKIVSRILKLYKINRGDIS